MSLFKRIFVEKRVRNVQYARDILKKLAPTPVEEVDRIQDIFERVKKPYLHKRTSLNLMLAQKDGALVKPAPDAYGLGSDPHYYFVHAYNCIYECEYCYLQGYFQSPDMVLFVNHEQVQAEMQQTIDGHQADTIVWFHAGEFSDSLAVSHITNEWALYWPFFQKNTTARLELRTKSVNTSPIEYLGPMPNIIVTFSLSPDEAIRLYDRKTPSLRGRLTAIQRLAEQGFQLGFHLDPIIDSENTIEQYRQLLDLMIQACPVAQIEYISLGVVRFTRDVFREFNRNYPDSKLNNHEYVKSFDNKIRYLRPHRHFLLKAVQQICLEAGVPSERIYLCMEDQQHAASH